MANNMEIRLFVPLPLSMYVLSMEYICNYLGTYVLKLVDTRMITNKTSCSINVLSQMVTKVQIYYTYQSPL